MLAGFDTDPDRILDLVKPEVIVVSLYALDRGYAASPATASNLAIISRYYRIAQEITVSSFAEIIPVIREHYLQNLIILGAQYIDPKARFDFYQPASAISDQSLPLELSQYAKIIPSFSLIIMPHTIAMRQAIWIAAQTFESLETDDLVLKSALALAYGWKKMDIVPQRITLASSPPEIRPVDTSTPDDLSDYIKYPGLRRLDGLVYLPMGKNGGYWRGLIEDQESAFYLQKRNRGFSVEMPWLIPRVLHIVGMPSINQLAMRRWSLLLKKGWQIQLHDINDREGFPNEWKMLLSLPGSEEIYSMAVLNMYGGFVVSAKSTAINGLPDWWRRYELVVSRNGATLSNEIIGSVPGRIAGSKEINKVWTGRIGLMRDKMAELERDRQSVYNKYFFEELRELIGKRKSVIEAMNELVGTRTDSNYFVIPDTDQYLIKMAADPPRSDYYPPSERLVPIRSHTLTQESIMAELRSARF